MVHRLGGYLFSLIGPFDVKKEESYGYKILLKLLEDQADPEKVPAMEAYMKNKFSFLGVQKPILKKIEREFLNLS